MGRLKGEGKDVALKSNTVQTILYHLAFTLSVVILLQSLKETVSTVYYYNLVNLAFDPIVVVLLVFLAPVAVGPLTRKLGWKTTFVSTGAVMASARLPMGMGLDQPYHLIFSTLALASSSLMISLIFALGRRERKVDGDVFSSQTATASVGIALMMMVLFRVLGMGVDVSIVPKAAGMVLSPLLSGVIALGLGFSIYGLKDSPVLDRTRMNGEVPGYPITGGAADSWAPAFGFAGFLIFAAAIVSDPQVVTAWTGQEFTKAASFTMFSLGLFILSLMSGIKFLVTLRRTFANPWGAILGNAVLIGGAFNIFYMGIDLGVIPGPIVWIAMVDLWVILDAFFDTTPFAGEPVEIERNGERKVMGIMKRTMERRSPLFFGKIMTMGVGSFFIFVLLLSMSLNWSFVPLGSLLKGGIPVIMMVGVAVLAVGGFSCSKGNIEEVADIEKKKLATAPGSPTAAAGEGSGHVSRGAGRSKRIRDLLMSFGAFALALILISGLSTFLMYSDEVDGTGVEAGDTLRVVTFNIHHGYSNEGRIDPVPHLELLRDMEPDIVFLQEADSVLINQGNFDPGAYLAGRLNMHYFRGASPGLGNPGTAVLSRFPLRELKVVNLHSDDIPRIAVTCLADIGSTEVALVGVHLGLEEDEREEQLKDVQSIVEGLNNMSLIMGGDFNTEPDEDMMTPFDPSVFGKGNRSHADLGLSSAWHSIHGVDDHHPTYPAPDLDGSGKHIDYIFFSPDLTVVDAGIGDGGEASDHRPVWADLSV